MPLNIKWEVLIILSLFLVLYTTVSDTHDYLCFVLENMPRNIIVLTGFIMINGVVLQRMNQSANETWSRP